MKALITRKVGMTSTIAEDGVVQAVTLLSTSPCVITQVKTDETDGYTAVQIGFEEAKQSNTPKAQTGHFKASGATPKIIREFRVDEITEDLRVGESISPEVFSVGDTVHVTGTSKGKGWAGTIRRHNFHRQRKTHGGKGNTRKVGSIGSMYPQHILKGKKMAGQLGGTQVTVCNLKVAMIDAEKGYIGVVGAVPGPRKSIVILKERTNMASVPTYTAAGAKATTAAKLSATVFGAVPENHQLLKQAYETYLANGRENLAVVKTRGLVSGGGKKPWKQKGTGRARFGSSRNPIWRGGGIVFGPTGEENYSKKLPVASKRLALRQALSLKAQDTKISVIENFDTKEGSTAQAAKLLSTLGVTRSVLLVVDLKDDLAVRATRNLQNVTLVQAKYLNVYDILNADTVVITKPALTIVEEWLGGAK